MAAVAAHHQTRIFMSNPAISPIQDIIADIRKGKMVIVVDDADRENEGDLIMAAQYVTPAAINFMAKHGRGLICVLTTSERLQQLGIER
jgi:3,4-dihydroxy 2-butanone 4-phosphate synthase/GTP cyclohydrolase II